MADCALYTVFNDAFVECGMNMIYSFVAHNQWFDGDIIILNDEGKYAGISDENKSKISKLHPNIIFANLNSNDYKDVFDNIGKLAAHENILQCYYKLEMLKKNQYKKKIYIDADAIVTSNLREITYSYHNTVACCDSICPIEMQFKTVSVIKDNDSYINAGVMIFDDSCIKDDDFDKAWEFCKNATRESFNCKYTQHGEMVDQDMFNEILETVVMVPPFIYNANPGIINDNNIGCAKIIHFCGDGKPWKPEFLSRYERVFSKYYLYDYFRRKTIGE